MFKGQLTLNNNTKDHQCWRNVYFECLSYRVIEVTITLKALFKNITMFGVGLPDGRCFTGLAGIILLI